MLAWKTRDDVTVEGAFCPVPECGTLTLAYRSADSVSASDADPCWFTCPRCGIDFVASGRDVIFRSALKDLFAANVLVE